MSGTRKKWALNCFGLIASVSFRFHMLKTMVWYRPFFKRIGSWTVIRNPLLIANPSCISIGTRVFIRDGARLEVVQRLGEPLPEVWIGSNVTIEQDFHLACCSRIWIADNVTIAARCAVVDITHPFWNVNIGESLAAAVLSGPHSVKIGEGTFLGIGVTVLPDVEIGEGVMVAAHSVVTTNLPPFCVAAGIPAKVLRYWK